MGRTRRSITGTEKPVERAAVPSHGREPVELAFNRELGAPDGAKECDALERLCRSFAPPGLFFASCIGSPGCARGKGAAHAPRAQVGRLAH